MTRKPFWGNDDGNVTLITRNTPLPWLDLYPFSRAQYYIKIISNHNIHWSKNPLFYILEFWSQSMKDEGGVTASLGLQIWRVQLTGLTGRGCEEPQSTRLLLLSAVVASWFIQQSRPALCWVGPVQAGSSSYSTRSSQTQDMCHKLCQTSWEHSQP